MMCALVGWGELGCMRVAEQGSERDVCAVSLQGLGQQAARCDTRFVLCDVCCQLLSVLGLQATRTCPPTRPAGCSAGGWGVGGPGRPSCGGTPALDPWVCLAWLEGLQDRLSVSAKEKQGELRGQGCSGGEGRVVGRPAGRDIQGAVVLSKVCLKGLKWLTGVEDVHVSLEGWGDGGARLAPRGGRVQRCIRTCRRTVRVACVGACRVQ
jgi:hypothetical protein